MNKAQLVAAIEPRVGSKRMAAEAVEAIVDTITMTVAAGERVSISGFGTFEQTRRGARVGRNPHTGEAVPIEATSSPRFRVGTGFKQVVRSPDARLEFADGVTARAAQAEARTATNSVTAALRRRPGTGRSARPAPLPAAPPDEALSPNGLVAAGSGPDAAPAPPAGGVAPNGRKANKVVEGKAVDGKSVDGKAVGRKAVAKDGAAKKPKAKKSEPAKKAKKAARL